MSLVRARGPAFRLGAYLSGFLAVVYAASPTSTIASLCISPDCENDLTGQQLNLAGLDHRKHRTVPDWNSSEKPEVALEACKISNTPQSKMSAPIFLIGHLAESSDNWTSWEHQEVVDRVQAVSLLCNHSHAPMQCL